MATSHRLSSHLPKGPRLPKVTPQCKFCQTQRESPKEVFDPGLQEQQLVCFSPFDRTFLLLIDVQ